MTSKHLERNTCIDLVILWSELFVITLFHLLDKIVNVIGKTLSLQLMEQTVTLEDQGGMLTLVSQQLF